MFPHGKRAHGDPIQGAPDREVRPIGRVAARVELAVRWLTRADSLSYVARGAGIVLALQLGGSAASYLCLVLLARWMGKLEFGVYGYVVAWAGLLSTFTRLGLSSATLRFLPELSVRAQWGRALGLLRGTWLIVLGTSVVVASLATAAILLAAEHVHIEHARAFVAGAWLVVPLALIALQAEMSRASRRVALGYGPPQLGKSLLMIAVAYPLVRALGGLTSAQAVVINVGALVALVVAQLALFWRGLPADIRDARPTYEPRAWFEVSLPMLLVASYGLVLNQVDVLLIGALLGPEQVGIYQAAEKSASTLALTLVATNAAAVPLYATLHARGEPRELQRLLSTAVGWSFWPSLLGFVTLVALGKPILGLFGPGFVAGRPQLAILGAGQVVNVACGPVLSLLSVSGHQRECSRVLGWTSLLNLALNSIAIPFFGLTGAALATAGSMVLWNVLLARIARRRLGIRTWVALT